MRTSAFICAGLAIILTLAAGSSSSARLPMDQFGKQWVKSHPFLTFMWYNSDRPLDSLYTDFGLTALSCTWVVGHLDTVNDAYDYGLTKQVQLNAVEVTQPFIDEVNATSDPNEDNSWYIRDEPSADILPGVGRVADWLRTNRPNGLSYVNIFNYWTDSDMNTILNAVHPDVLMVDFYPFDTNSSGGERTVEHFKCLSKVRARARAYGIPYFSWMQTFRQVDAGDYATRMPSESEIRMQIFSTLTAGYKGIGYFAFDGPTGNPATSQGLVVNGVRQPIYYHVQTVNPWVKNLGAHLRHLESSDYRFVPGPGHTTPTSTYISNWTYGAGGDTRITGISVSGTATNKDGMIGLFTDDKGNRWFMLTNLYRGNSLSAADATASFTITFDSSVNTVHRVERTTGQQTAVDLTNHQLTLSLEGGTGELFSYDLSAIPTFSPDAGVYNTSQTVTISSARPDAVVRYTTDGSDPTVASPLYTSPISITAQTLLRASAWFGGGSSPTGSASYGFRAVAPTFSPAAGAYPGPQSVALSTVTPGAYITYTTDGSLPTTSSTAYVGPINVSSSMTIKAVAWKAGWFPSKTVSASYTIPPPATPTFSPGSGSYNDNLSVTVSCTTPGVTIRYTTDGTEPTTGSTLYTGPISVVSPTFIKAAAWSASDRSATGSAGYAFRVGTPTFSIPTGTYPAPQSISLSTVSTGAYITYTTNGSYPGTSSPTYTDPIILSETTTLKAVGWKTGWNASLLASATYTLIPDKKVQELKRLADDVEVGHKSGIVTAVFGNSFYIEEDDRVSGIQVVKSSHGADLGVRVDVAGILRTDSNDERYISAGTVVPNGSGSVAPLAMGIRSLGGADWFYNDSTGAGQRGVLDSYGPNTIGLFVRTWGRVIDPRTTTSFYLDDGSGVLVQVTAPSGSVPSAGSYAAVAGISSCEVTGPNLTPVVRARQASDITVF